MKAIIATLAIATSIATVSEARENRILNTSGVNITVSCVTAHAPGASSMRYANTTVRHGEQVSCYTPSNALYPPNTMVRTYHGDVQVLKAPHAGQAITQVLHAGPHGWGRKVIHGNQSNPGGVAIGIR